MRQIVVQACLQPCVALPACGRWGDSAFPCFAFLLGCSAAACYILQRARVPAGLAGTLECLTAAAGDVLECLLLHTHQHCATNIVHGL
jgi:hypothetical protein